MCPHRSITAKGRLNEHATHQQRVSDSDRSTSLEEARSQNTQQMQMGITCSNNERISPAAFDAAIARVCVRALVCVGRGSSNKSAGFVASTAAALFERGPVFCASGKLRQEQRLISPVNTACVCQESI